MIQTVFRQEPTRPPEPEPSQIKLATTYFPDAVRWLLVLGFGGLAAYATYDGLYQLIAANSPNGTLDLETSLPIKFFSVLLILTVVYVLYKLRTTRSTLATLGFASAYLVLTFISTGLGFGFYWKWINSQNVQTEKAKDAINLVTNEFAAADKQLDILAARAKTLNEHSSRMEQREISNGDTCEVRTIANRGPRQRLRAEDARNAAAFQDFLQSSGGFVKKDINELEQRHASIGHASTPEAQLKEIEDLNTRISAMADEYNKFRASKTLAGFQAQVKKRLATTLFDDTPPRPQFRCADPVLDTALTGVLGAMQDLPQELHPAPIAGVVGSRATLEAFSRLGNFVLDLAPPISSGLANWGFTTLWVTKIRTLADQTAAVQSPGRPAAERSGGLDNRDRLPLAVAVLVDFCLFIATRPARRINIKSAPGAQNLATELRKLSSTLDAESLFNDYIFSRVTGHYVFVPVGVGRSGDTDPDRQQRMRDRAMALAFASLDQPEVGLFKRKAIPGRFGPRRALLERGRKYLQSHREYAVYRFYPNAMQEMLDALIRHPEMPPVTVGPVQGTPPRPQDFTNRPQSTTKAAASPPTPPGPNGMSQPSSTAGQRADAPAPRPPGQQPRPRGQPPGI